MEPIDYVRLKQIFLEVLANVDSFQTLKRIDEFKVDEKYIGDMFNYTIFEDRKGEPPIFYQINSPYDIISKKSPQQALVFQAGKLLQNIDYTQYVQVRTGLLAAMAISDLVGSPNLLDKTILLVGSGGVAKRSVEALAQLTRFEKVQYTNRSGRNSHFEQHASKQGVEASYVELSDLHLGDYDIVLMHTSSPEPIFGADNKAQLKPGSLILTFVDTMELDPLFCDSSKANLIIDHSANLDLAKDLKKACEEGYCKREEFTVYLDVLAKKTDLTLDPEKYTLFRSKGTSFQNIAMLKYLQ